MGLLGALELVADKAKRTSFPPHGNAGTNCRDHCFQNGLIMRAIRDTMVLAPPFIITEAEVEKLLAKAKRCIDLTATDLETPVIPTPTIQAPTLGMLLSCQNGLGKCAANH